jgi:hypothetical protein
MKTVEEVMKVLNVDRVTAGFILAIESGETKGDVITVDEHPDDRRGPTAPPPDKPR